MRMLCDMDDVPLLSIAEEGERFVQNEDHWTVQIFRSIDAYSTHVSHLRRLSEGAKLQKVGTARVVRGPYFPFVFACLMPYAFPCAVH
jgi:hypothetical protein